MYNVVVVVFFTWDGCWMTRLSIRACGTFADISKCPRGSRGPLLMFDYSGAPRAWDLRPWARDLRLGVRDLRPGVRDLRPGVRRS